MTSEPAIPGLSPEAELLLYCARTSIDPLKAWQAESVIHRGVDWQHLLSMAASHRVLPLLHRSLGRIHPQSVPVEILDLLHQRVRANAAKNFFLTAELLRLLQLLKNHGIQAIPFKGPALAATAYGDLTLRQFGDLDILIRKREFFRTRDLLVSCGYEPWGELTRTQEEQHLEMEHAVPFSREGGRIEVDVHWKTAAERYCFALDPETLWSRLEQVSLGGKTVPSLHPEDQLLILCMHGSKQCWERLGWICDVAELSRSCTGINWERVIQRARAIRSERMFLTGLYLAAELLRAPLPREAAAAAAGDPAVRSVARRLYRRLFPGILRPIGPLVLTKKTMLYMAMRENRADQCSHLRHRLREALAPGKRDFAMVVIPGPFAFLYYPLRLLRLTTVYTGAAVVRFWRKLRRRPATWIRNGGTAPTLLPGDRPLIARKTPTQRTFLHRADT